jgi:pilus assembly protein CpaB
MTVRGENNNASTTTARTVLQNVQVLATGTKMDPDPTGKPENVTVVTLLVTPEQSQKLALAQSQGTIQFVLRNGGDSANPETPAVDMAGLTGVQNVPPVPLQPARPKRVAAVVNPSDAYRVETVANGKVTVATFHVNPE